MPRLPRRGGRPFSLGPLRQTPACEGSAGLCGAYSACVPPRRFAVRLSSGLAALTLAALVPAAPSTAVVPTPIADQPGPSASCDRGVPGSRADGRIVEPDPSASEVGRYEARFSSAFEALPRAVRRATLQDEGRKVTIPVHVHAIQRSKNQVRASRSRIKRQIRIMNRAYQGTQSALSAKTRFRFELASIDRTVNKRWYSATFGDRAEHKMKRRLHKGGRATLNLYLSAPKWGLGAVYGWATFPAEYARHPRLDGVVVNYAAMPNGKAKRRAKGDTAVHEAGHWLGLYHTFQGGCSKRNDRVGDTPRELETSYRCATGRDSCAAPGDDPVHNFMDYSHDNCRNQFTVGQSRRMNKQWAAFRAR